MGAIPQVSPIHQLTNAAMARSLHCTALIMDKAESHAVAEGIPLDVYLQARLFPDMFSLLQQLQYVSYLAVDYAKHFSDAPPPRVGYDETSWPELRHSLQVAGDYLAAISPDQVVEHADKVVPIFIDENRGMTTVDYASTIIVPDFYFHMTLAYALLRHNGVPLSKSDFLGNLATVALPYAAP